MSIQRIMLERFNALYGAPDTSDPKRLIAEYIRAFEKVDPQLLAAAVDRVIAIHRYKSWPTPGEVNHELKQVAEKQRQDRETRRLALPLPPSPPLRTGAEKKRVDDVFKRFKADMAAKAMER